MVLSFHRRSGVANRSVTLYRKCKTSDGWKRFPVVMSANGRVKTDAVIEKGIETVYPVGHYELRSFEGSKTVWKRVEGNATEALAALKETQKKATAIALAGDAGVGIIEESERKAIKAEAGKFVEAAKDRGSLEAAEIYERTLEDFLLGCRKTYVDELVHDDVVRFHRAMRERGLAPRTISNRHANLCSFFSYLGFDKAKMKVVSGPKPRYEKTLPEIYEPDDLKSFFASLEDEYDQLFFDVLLQTGLREREAVHLEWTDISRARKTLKVQSKPKWNHKVKDAEERELPISQELLDRLTAYHEDHKGALVFGKNEGKTDNPETHFLRRLKRLARKAKLNCGVCETCVASKQCDRWFLHKFRATYITTLLRNGMDLRTVMKLSGHSDIESVMRYLRPAEDDAVQERVNAIKWR
jgi:integrase